MSDTPSPRRLPLRLKFAALGAIGAAMVLLPLGQVLRYQSAELKELVAERATLDPLAQALAVQRGLLGHRDVAERVLRGRLQLEGERRLRKAEVDESLWTLQATLSAGFWVKALGESNSLTQDWRLLAGRIAQRQLQVVESHASHQLLLEQAVQVMDLVSAAAPAGAQANPLRLASIDPASAQTRTPDAPALPRLAALESAVQARASELDERGAALRERQALLALAGSAFAMLALAAALCSRRSIAPVGTPGAPGTPNLTDEADPVRRNRGRRSADSATSPAPQTTSQQVLQRLREASVQTTAKAPGSQPPLS